MPSRQLDRLHAWIFFSAALAFFHSDNKKFMLYLRNLMPRKLFASSRFILLPDMFSRRNTELRAKVPLWVKIKVRNFLLLIPEIFYLAISGIALYDTLQKLNFVRSDICDESNFVSSLWLMSRLSKSRRFLNWFFFSSFIWFPCKSRSFNFRSDLVFKIIKI